jgi:hypothetical protein
MSAVSMTGGCNSSWELALGFSNISVTITSSGTTNGTVKVQYSDFGDSVTAPTSAQAVDYPGSSQSVAFSSAAGGYQIQNTGFKWFRLVFTDSGGSTGTVSAAVSKRGVPR